MYRPQFAYTNSMPRLPADQRRRQLLEIAADVFARRGYHGATTAELAREAGVTEPVLYQHFAGKLDLFVTLVDELGEVVINAWQSALESTTDPAQRLKVLLAGNPAVHERGRGVYRVIFHAMTEAAADEELLKPLRAHLRRLHTFIAAELEQLQKTGTVRSDQPAATLAWALMHSAIGFGMTAQLGVPGHATAASSTLMQNVALSIVQK